MNKHKLFAAAIAAAFALGSVAALADDTTQMPLSKMDTQTAKQARADAKAKWDKMTPEEQAAAKKAARGKRQADQTAVDEIANRGMKYDTKKGSADAAKSKTMAKPTKE